MQWSLISQIIFCIYLDDVNLDILKLGFLGIFIDWVPVHELIVAIIAKSGYALANHILHLLSLFNSYALLYLYSFCRMCLCFFTMAHLIGLWSDYVISWSYFFFLLILTY